MAAFKNNTPMQKYQLQVLIECVRNYVRMVELPEGCRLRKVCLEFTGDRLKPTDIKVKFVRIRKED